MESLTVHPSVLAARELRGADRDAHARSLDLARRAADAVWFATVDEVDQTLSFKDDGHRTAACWVQAVTNCAPSDAKREVRVARMIRHLPIVGDALLVGHIGTPQIAELLHLWRNPRVRDVLPALIDELIERASLMPLLDFRIVCQRVAAFADPDGAHRDHEMSRANRHLSLVPDGAGFRLHAEGDALSGAIVQEVLDRYVQAEFDADWAAGVAEHGDRMCPALLRRTHRQRQFDAFIEMARAAAEAGVSGSVVALVNIHCDQQTAEDAIRNGFADNGNAEIRRRRLHRSLRRAQ